MSNEQAPECCPFCGAARKAGCGFAWFECGTMTAPADNNRRDQTPACAHAERERLTRELNDANAQLKNDADVIVKMGKQIDRMEQAGNCLLIDNKSDANVTAWNKAKEFQP